MLKIRFLKTGRKNQPFYQIVVTDSRNAPQGGRFIEKLGFFNPFTKEQRLDQDRIKHWLAVGAQSSGRVHNLLVDAKIIEGPKIDVGNRRAKDKKGAVEDSASERPKAAAEGEPDNLK